MGELPHAELLVGPIGQPLQMLGGGQLLADRVPVAADQQQFLSAGRQPGPQRVSG
ncbi:MAG: hypothetical protein V9G10_10635 [Candidatus Nanopelagicales bacterium]